MIDASKIESKIEKDKCDAQFRRKVGHLNCRPGCKVLYL